MTRDRDVLRETFDAAAERYDRARPAYPADLFDTLVREAAVGPGDRVLEIGCATGTATKPLVARGLQVTCVELGAELAARARRTFATNSLVEVVHANFEAWEPPDGAMFDLVAAATSWHWIDPESRYQKAWSLLRPGGHLAFWSALHVFPDDGDPFFEEIQSVYDEIGESLPADAVRPKPGQLNDERLQIEASGLFENPTISHFDWEVTYTADEYIDLLETFSGHIAMQTWQRDRLYGAIRELLASRSDPRVRRHWGAALHVARRVDNPDSPRRTPR